MFEKRSLSLICIFFMAFALPFGAQGAQEASRIASPTSTVSPEIKDETGGRWSLYGDFAGRYNPLGVGVFGGVNYRDVYRYDKSRELQDAYWQTGVGIGLSPSAAWGSVHAEWMPWIVLPLRLQYDYYHFLGAYYGLLSFDSPQASLDEDLLDDRTDQETADGHRFLFQPTLQGKIGPVILRNRTDLAYYLFSGKGPYFLELEYFMLLKDRDWLISNRTEAMMEVWKGPNGRTLLMGPYYEVTHAGSTEITQQKVGALLYWVPMEKLAFLGRPHAGLKLGYYAQDPDRRGEFYGLFVMGFELDLR